MKKNITCFIFLFISLFIFNIDAKAEETQTQTCYYNTTGYNAPDGSDGDKTYYVQVDFYYNQYGQLTGSKIYNGGNECDDFAEGIFNGNEKKNIISYLSNYFN